MNTSNNSPAIWGMATILSQSLAIRRIVFGLALLLMVPGVSHGFDNRLTHRQITRSAARASTLDSFLRSNLGLPNGIENQITSTSGTTQIVRDWLEDGSTLEDIPNCRASNHFHNPLKPFTDSAVSDLDVFHLFCGNGQLFSNVTWGTRFTSPTDKGPATGNTLDWNAARKAYFDAWTLETKDQREAALADTFLALGHVLHLVQDLAVPAHVRDDFQSHLDCIIDPNRPWTQWCFNGFEEFVRNNRGLVDAAGTTAVPFQNERVTRFWDKDQYSGGNPSAGLTQGLAEYTNANYFSLNTIFTEDKPSTERYAFPYPAKSSTNLSAFLNKTDEGLRSCAARDGALDAARYLSKTGDGETVDRFVNVSYLYRNVIETSPSPPSLGVQGLGFKLDDCVHTDYATKLLPRAIGYSAGLLNYFFRGTLALDVRPNGEEVTRNVFTITNTSTEPMGGTFTLYAEDTQGVRREVQGLSPAPPTNLAPGEVSDKITITAMPEGLIRAFVLVFKGTLGAEQPGATVGDVGAVAGAIQPWDEENKPTPWEPPYIFVIQESAEHTGEDELNGGCTEGTDDNCRYGLKERSKDSLKQRSKGSFFAPHRADAGRYIQGVFVTRAFGNARLKINGIDIGSTSWDRDTFPILISNPSTWEIEDGVALEIAIQTVSGKYMHFPLVAWGPHASWVQIWSDKTLKICPPDTQSSCVRSLEKITSVGARVLYGDASRNGFWEIGWDLGAYPFDTSPNSHTSVGFRPTGSVGGYSVGELRSDPFPNKECGCFETGDREEIAIFAKEGTNGKEWNKDSFSIGTTKYTLGIQGPPVDLQVCLFSGGGVEGERLEPPALDQTVTIERDYLPEELAYFSQLGVTPPEYSITLK